MTFSTLQLHSQEIQGMEWHLGITGDLSSHCWVVNYKNLINDLIMIKWYVIDGWLEIR